MAISTVLPTLLSGLVFGVAPESSHRIMSDATTAICQDGHVAYSDPQERVRTCLRHSVAKIDKSLKEHGIDSQNIDALRNLSEGP